MASATLHLIPLLKLSLNYIYYDASQDKTCYNPEDRGRLNSHRICTLLKGMLPTPMGRPGSLQISFKYSFPSQYLFKYPLQPQVNLFSTISATASQRHFEIDIPTWKISSFDSRNLRKCPHGNVPLI